MVQQEPGTAKEVNIYIQILQRPKINMFHADFNKVHLMKVFTQEGRYSSLSLKIKAKIEQIQLQEPKS